MSSEAFIDTRELPEVRYLNEYVKKWSEVAAALRYRLRIEERDAYDAKARQTSPAPLEPGDLVEIKACKKWVENGDQYGTSGRWSITTSSHDELLGYGGYYVLVVYDLVQHRGGERVLIEGIDLMSAETVDDELFRPGEYDTYRLGYKTFFPEIHPSHESGHETPAEPSEYSGGHGSEDTEQREEPASVPEDRPEIETVVSTEEEYPDDLRDREIWLTWAFDSENRKVPRAPWMTGTCYPVPWGSDVSDRPETDFEEAYRYSRFGSEIRHQWPFPEGAPDMDLKLGMLLPHDPPDPPIMQIDLDNVRHPETGAITPEAADVLERFPAAYAQISTSGTGIHLYVRAALPDRMGKFIETIELLPRGPTFDEFDEPQQIEMYDHGRFVAVTGEHIDGWGTEIPEAVERVAELVDEFETGPASEGESGEFDFDAYEPDRSESSGERSPYFDEPIRQFGKPKANTAGTGEGFGGAHPAHGGTSSPDAESTNYAVNVRENVWHCFAHNSGGGPLSLVAVMEGYLDCSAPRLRNLSDEEFSEVCLAARGRYGFSGDPPYRALVGIAREHGLAMADESDGILGRDAFEVARKIFDGSEP